SHAPTLSRFHAPTLPRFHIPDRHFLGRQACCCLAALPARSCGWRGSDLPRFLPTGDGAAEAAGLLRVAHRPTRSPTALPDSAQRPGAFHGDAALAEVLAR